MENPKERIEDILKRNPYLDAKVGLGYDNFLDFTCGRQFYVDKTHFISEWMRSDAKVTLITRPRRFGKTTLFSTVETFFDPKYAKHPEYFEKLCVWKDKKSREMFGKISVISVSFGSCKGMNYEQSMKNMMFSFFEMYEKHSYLQDSTELSESEKQQFTEAKESFLQAGERMTGRQSSGYATFYTDITRCCQLFLWMNMTHHCSKRTRRGIGMR